MALDAATLALTAAELKATLTDAKIAKLFEPTRDELVLTLRKNGKLEDAVRIRESMAPIERSLW